VLLAGIPADTPARSDRNVAAIGSGDPAFARDHQEELRMGGRVRADDTTRLEGQAGQMDLAVTRRDAGGGESLAAEPLDDLLPAVELEDFHGLSGVLGAPEADEASA
jgi:hypothetical protein